MKIREMLMKGPQNEDGDPMSIGARRWLLLQRFLREITGDKMEIDTAMGAMEFAKKIKGMTSDLSLIHI